MTSPRDSTVPSRARRVDEFTSLAEIERAVRALMPVLLFTVLRRHDDGALGRIHSSQPQSYPVGGRKSTDADLAPEWIRRCLQEQLPLVGNTAPELRRVFADYARIERLGCASFINAPVVDDNRTIATLCVLAAADAYGPDEVAAAARLAGGSAYAVLAAGIDR